MDNVWPKSCHFFLFLLSSAEGEGIPTAHHQLNGLAFNATPIVHSPRNMKTPWLTEIIYVNQRGDFLLQCLKLEIVGIENKALYSLRNVEIEILK